MASEEPVVRQPQRIRRNRRSWQRLWELRPFFALIAVSIVAMLGGAYWYYGRTHAGVNIDHASPVVEGLSVSEAQFVPSPNGKQVLTGYVKNSLTTPVRSVMVRMRWEDDGGAVGMIEAFLPQIPASGKTHFQSAEIPNTVKEFYVLSIQGVR